MKARLILALDVRQRKGESADSAHQGWIELIAAHWGVVQSRSVTASMSGGHTSAHSEHRTLSFSKLVDLASPILMQHCSMGKTINDDKVQKALGASVRSCLGHDDHFHVGLWGSFAS